MMNWEGIDIKSVVRSAKCGEDDAIAAGSILFNCL